MRPEGQRVVGTRAAMYKENVRDSESSRLK